MCSAPHGTLRGNSQWLEQDTRHGGGHGKSRSPEKSSDSPGSVVTCYKTAWAHARHSFFHVFHALHSLFPGSLEYILFLLNFLLTEGPGLPGIIGFRPGPQGLVRALTPCKPAGCPFAFWVKPNPSLCPRPV